MSEDSKRYRNWCFTLTKEVSLDWESLIGDVITYICVGDEIGESGYKHWQGYAEFSKPMSRNNAKKMFHDKMHLKQRFGTQEQAINYCKKDGNFQEFGVRKKQGKRSDLDACREMIKEGKKNYEIVEEVTSFQAVKCLDTLRYMMVKPRPKDVKPKVYWIYGPTGTGKTVKAKEILGEYDDCDYHNNFLIGYTGSKNVLFDDFRGGIPLHILLRMLDYGQCTVNVKNGSVFFAAEVVVITAPWGPAKVFKNAKDENIGQLTRRIDELICTDPCTEVGG